MANFEKQILELGEKQKILQLEELVKRIPLKSLIEALIRRTSSDGIAFWNYLLKGFSDDYESKEKRFECVKALLNYLNSLEISYKLTYDVITRLCLDLPSFSNEHLIEIVEFSIDGLRIGDPKCVGWKDLLPETLLILSSQCNLNVNGVKMSGSEYRNNLINNLTTMRWPIEILTPIANMFGELKLSTEETTTILQKFSNSLQKLSPSELPALAYQLITLCKSASQIITPILAFEKYFYRHYYKKLFSEMDSNTTDLDSIDSYSEKELREAEETVLHHLSYCTQFRISELQMCNALKSLSSSPDIILTPFVLSAALSMTRTNRDPDLRISNSIILPFLRNIIKNNEDEKTLVNNSAWCRNSFYKNQIDMDRIFSILIDQSSDGKDLVTPGVVNLAFTLLKAKNSPKLNQLGIVFLTKFIKKRFVFGQGVIKNLAEWMIIEQDALQYSECLTILSMADTFTVSECVKSINYVLEFFLWIPGEQSMRMMTFILPIIKISHTVRDAFIEVLRKAMHSKDLHTCQMGVYGFCCLLKQLTNSNSQRGGLGPAGNFTQQNISGFSLMSQTQLSNRNNPQRHFDMLTLEIIGLLRNCFNQNLEIKETLYENLNRAIELNVKLIPHILQFIDAHFRSYFEYDDETEFKINFEKTIKCTKNEFEFEVLDNLGKLTIFVSNCVITCDKLQLSYDTSVIKNILNKSIEKISEKEYEFVQLLSATDGKKIQIQLQQLNFLEALMAYALWTSEPTNNNVKYILNMFKQHFEISTSFKIITLNKKEGKKTKTTGNDTDTEQVPNVSINNAQLKKSLKIRNIWDLRTIERFLRLLNDDIVPFAYSSTSAPLRSNCDLVNYVLQATSYHLEHLRNEPPYKQISHSRKALKNLIDVTRVLYERCIKKLAMLWGNFNVRTAYLAAECMFHSLQTVEQVFKKKVDVYLKGIDILSTSMNNKQITTVLEEIIDESMSEEKILSHEQDGKKIAFVLLQCLEILYNNLDFNNRLAMDGYSWLFKFCQTNKIESKELGLVHKLLFIQREKTHTGPFYSTFAMHLELTLGQLEDTSECKPHFDLKSITLTTSESCSNYLCNTIRKQLDDVDFFITKANSIHWKLRLSAEDDQDIETQMLKDIERSICHQLVHIGNTLVHLTNVCLPLGSCMDNLVKILTQMYICLTNCSKHFILRNSIIPVSLEGTKFNNVLRTAGKPLGNRIYALISYIEANIFEGNVKAKNNPAAAKAKVLKETKLLPKLILRVENFNKFVIHLSKITKTDLASFLHIGTVRDFRIKTSELKEAIDETLTHSSQIEVGESILLEQADDINENDVRERLDSEVNKKRRDIGGIISSGSTEEMTPTNVSTISPLGVLALESNDDSNTQILKNLAKVNAKTKNKRKSKKCEEDLNEPEPKRKRGRPARQVKSLNY